MADENRMDNLDMVNEVLDEALGDVSNTELDEATLKKKQNRMRLIKTAIVLIFSLIILIFAAIAWFSMSKNVTVEGMKVKVKGDLYTIVPVGDDVGIYDDISLTDTYVRDKLLNKASKQPDVITWTITKSTGTVDPDTGEVIDYQKGKDFGNSPQIGNIEPGISPGSSGEIQFKVIPNESIDATFDFYLYGYSADYDENGEPIKNTIEILSDTGEEAITQKLFNGHILLFENYDETTGKYSGLIESAADFHRLMPNSSESAKTFDPAVETETTVSIYWIWPETLAEIMLDENNPDHVKYLRTKKNICSTSEVRDFFKKNPTWFLYNPETPTETWTNYFNENMTDAQVVARAYEDYMTYSAYYNDADQCIGTNAAYVLLDMNSSAEPHTGNNP